MSFAVATFAMAALPTAAFASYADLDPLFPELGAESAAVTQPISHASGRGAGGGLATWYGPGFHGRKTASGERFDSAAMTAAHRSLPFGTRVRVDAANGRSVVVRINDRGPHRRGAVIDLSKGSAAALGMGGTMRVSLTVL